MKHPAVIAMKAIQIFNHLPSQTLELISRKCDLCSYRPNGLIFSENAKANRVGFIVSGFVKLMRGDRKLPLVTEKDSELGHVSDKQMLVDLLGPGDSLGAACALLGDLYSSSAIAITPCNVAFLSADAFVSMLHQIDGLSERVMQSLAKSLVESEKHAQIMNGDLKTRVMTIRRRCSHLGIDVDQWLSNAEVARMAGATRVAVSQIMSREKRSQTTRM
ncbi:MAG: Crp/Fnr family transcriptional regulator [Rhodocyclaceae bacterium]|nr:Crp/Fnr family transcriptional regulator [Rhodocyclaceae bacterium]